MIRRCIIRASSGAQNALVHQPYRLDEPRKIIETLRVKHGFSSVRALAIAAGINQPTLARYMNGTTATMEVASFMALANTLHVTVSELLGEVPLSSGGRVKELAAIMRELPEPQSEALLAAGKALLDAAKRRP